MKNNNSLRLTAILFCCCTCFSVITAQTLPGYCITSAGDSIRGTVNVQEATNLILFFKTEGAEKWTRFEPEKVKKIVLESGAIYLPHKVVFRSDTQSVFLHSLVTGAYNLYQTSTQQENR